MRAGVAETHSIPSSSHLSQKKRSLSQHVMAITHVQVHLSPSLLTRESVHLVQALDQQSVTPGRRAKYRLISWNSSRNTGTPSDTSTKQLMRGCKQANPVRTTADQKTVFWNWLRLPFR